MLLWACITIVFAFLFGIGPAFAHESRPLYVEIQEKSANTFSVTWKIPPSTMRVTSPSVVMPQSCTAAARPSGTKLIKRQLFRCTTDLSGEKIRVDFPGHNPVVTTLFRLQWISGEKYVVARGPRDPSWQVPDREATISVAWQYLSLGIEHILKGYDHLLFIACLVLIAGTWRRILITVTGFTVAHSITLALAALDLVRIPVAPVEAVIALSIVFLASEILREKRDTLTWRFPITVAGSFGLLHGFGFASVLNEIGLPQTEVPVALLFFNVGVEIGQVVFVALFIAATAVLNTIFGGKRSNDQTDIIPIQFAWSVAYIIGPLAAFWMLYRIAGFWT